MIISKINAWLKQTDRNGDGKLSEKEFKKTMLAYVKDNNIPT